MSARRTVDPDTILDAARDLIAAGGPRAATLEAIVAASGAPTGSIYHRFETVDAVVARTWLRALRRSREALLGAAITRMPVHETEASGSSGVEAVVATALAAYDFCLRERAEARVLAALRPADLLRRGLPRDVATEVSAANELAVPVLSQLSRACLDRDDPQAIDAILLAIVDLPFGAASRYLDLDGSPPPARRAALEAAVRGMLAPPA